MRSQKRTSEPPKRPNFSDEPEIMQRFSQAKAFTKLVLLRNDADGRRVLDNPQALLVIRIPADSSHKPVT